MYVAANKSRKVLTALVIIMYSFWCERMTMNPNANIKSYIGVKILFCIVVFSGVFGVDICAKNINGWERKKKKSVLVIMGICLIANLITLFLIWPGMWGGMSCGYYLQ